MLISRLLELLELLVLLELLELLVSRLELFFASNSISVIVSFITITISFLVLSSLTTKYLE